MVEVFLDSELRKFFFCFFFMFKYIRAQVEHLMLHKSGFTTDHIMYLHIDKLELTQGGPYIRLSNEWRERRLELMKILFQVSCNNSYNSSAA